MALMALKLLQNANACEMNILRCSANGGGGGAGAGTEIGWTLSLSVLNLFFSFWDGGGAGRETPKSYLIFPGRDLHLELGTLLVDLGAPNGMSICPIT